MTSYKNKTFLRQALLLVVCVLVFIPFTVQSQTKNNIGFRIEGSHVFYRATPDSVYARVAPGYPVQLFWSCETTVNLGMVSAGFKLYSPDGSILNLMWNSPVVPIGEWADPSVFSLEGGAAIGEGPDGFNGTLPSSFLVLGATLIPGNGGYGPTVEQDVLSGVVTVSQEGILCVDSSFIPPAGVWLFDGIEVLWGADVGGYPAGGFCFEIAECTTCNVAGDSNGDGVSNIADVVYDIDRVFSNGPAFPCPREGDANGDGMFNISDVFRLISWHFSGGPGPICGP